MADQDYQAAAIAALKSGTPEVKAPAEAAPELKLDESKLVVDPGVKPAKVEEKIEKAPSDSIAKSFEKLAREKAALREKEAKVSAATSLEAKLGPQGLHALSQALEKGDVKSILSALGVKPGDVQYQAEKARLDELENPPNEALSKVELLEKEIREMREERQRERMEKGRNNTLETVKTLAKDPKYQYVNEMDGHAEALQLVEDYIRKNGEWPAETREDSIKLGLDIIEERYAKQAEKWKAVLTKSKGNETIQPEGSPAQPTSAVSEQASSKSLSNVSAPAPVRADTPAPKTPEEYQRAAINALKQFQRT